MSNNDNTKKKINNVKGNKDSNDLKDSNIIFYCEQCKKIPLIIPSNISNKMIKYCHSHKAIELITPTNLLNMINVKINKKKDNLKKSDNTNNWKDFICSLHGKEFINYCDDCSKDICYDCSNEHFNHKLFHFSNLLPSNKDIREGNKILSEMKKDLEKFKQNSKEIIKICDNLINLKEIILNALNSVDYKKINFYTIMNYKNILKIKIKLNDKLYYVINPLIEMNSKLLNSINKNFQNQINESSLKEKSLKNTFDNNVFTDIKNKEKNKTNYLKNNNNNLSLNNIEISYQKFLKIMEDTFEFDNKKKLKLIDNNYENNAYIDIKSNDYKISNSLYEDNTNKYFNSENKKNYSLPLVNQFNLKFNQDILFKDNIFNKQLELFEEKTKINISEFEQSTITENLEMNYIINLISSKINKKIKKLYLCYRATKDGDQALNFHQKCDYIKNIIILIRTSLNKKFGGFSTESWDVNTEYTWKKDEHAFIFSLNGYNSNFYNVIKPEKALLCYKKCGPIFGNGEIFIPDNFFNSISSCQETNTYYESKGNSYPLNGEKEFNVAQIEAYKVDYE